MEPLIVSGRLESLGAITKYVTAAAAAAGLDKKATYSLRLAIDEIASNITIHGYQEAGLEGALICQAVLDEQTLTITLEDTGIPYDSTQSQPPDYLHLPLDQREIGGLGVYLAYQGVDQFLYERDGDQNRNIFIVNRPAAS